MRDTGIEVRVLGTWSGYRVWVLAFRAEDLGFRNESQGLEIWVEGLWVGGWARGGGRQGGQGLGVGVRVGVERRGVV